jgi:hypothetical protein
MTLTTFWAQDIFDEVFLTKVKRIFKGQDLKNPTKKL